MLFSYSIVVNQCSSDEGKQSLNEKPKSRIAIGLTIIPSGFKNIQSTFITISEIRINGKKLDGFFKQSIDLSAYQEGDIKLIFNGKAEVKKYTSVTVILDYESDKSGNFPGCYILTENNMKYCLGREMKSKAEITIQKTFEIRPESHTELVIGFDLRKAITFDNVNKNYRFFNDGELAKAIKVMVREDCGEVKGNIKKPFSISNDLYVFIYRKGEFDKFAELKGLGGNDILFPNAVGCSKVKAYGSYQLPLIEEGEYEIHLGTCDKNLGDQFLFKGKINPTSNISGLLLNNIPVSANSHIQLNIDVLGVI